MRGTRKLTGVGAGVQQIVKPGFSPTRAYGDYALFQSIDTPQKRVAKAWRVSSQVRAKPVTLPTKPFNHREDGK